MIRSLKWHLGSLLVVAALLLTGGRAGAQCFGDCNGSNSLTASDLGRINSTILRCGPCPGNVPGGISTGCAALANGCPPADFNADSCIRASELARANQNILKFQPSGCQPTNTPDVPTVTPTPTGGDNGFCGNMNLDAGEECDDGGSCFGGANAGMLCTTKAACPGGDCKGFGGDGCAANCTNEKNVAYLFSGALCKGGGKNGQPCKFIANCTGGPLAGRPCTLDAQCGTGGTCVSECGAGAACYGDGECTAGPTLGGACFMVDATTEAKFCASGANQGKVCNADADCNNIAGACKGSCGTGGVCENRSRSALISLSVPVNIGPMIGSSILHVGKPDPVTGLVPVATHLGDTVFDPVKVPGLVCACVRGQSDPNSHGPGNTGSGNINCGAGTIANDVTLGQDHNTSLPGTCTAGANIGAACQLKCAALGTRAGLPCNANSDCPGSSAAQRQCNGTTDCGVSTGCNVQNGPGTCVGGSAAGRACFNNAQCPSGKCTGKCISGTVGAACSCDGTSRFCGSGLAAPNDVTQCGAGGVCRVTGNGGGFCMGPPRFCVGGTGGGKACYNDAECGAGGTCPGTGNFLKACTTNADCPGSLCNSIDDATCTLQDPPPPAGSGAKACLEKKEICTTGFIGQACTADNQCGTGGKCGTTCSAQSPHAGICNSPAHITLTGAAGSGSALFLNTIALGTISDGGTCALAALCSGGANDLLPCLIAGDCPGGACVTAACAGTCSNDATKFCIANGDCAGGACTPGTNFKAACTSAAQCGGAPGSCGAVSTFAAGASLGAGKGLDGLPCTDDDAAAVRGNQQTIPQTTGRGSAFISDVGSIAGQQYTHKACVDSADPSKCLSSLVGQGLNCASLMGENPSAAGLRLASVFPTLDGQTGDAVVLTFLTAR